LSVHRVRDSDNDDTNTVSTIIVPHSQFYRFCSALARKTVLKQSDSEVTRDSNGNTVSSVQSSSMDERRSSNADKTLHKSNSCGDLPSCSGEITSEAKTKTDNTSEIVSAGVSKKSNSTSISTILKARLIRRGVSNRKLNAKRKSSKMQRKERRATKTLGVVVGVFLLCWVPFFTMNILNAVCILLKVDACVVNFDVFFYCTWIGYMNSFMNPIIYTIFNAEFRRAFKLMTDLHIFVSLETD
uniref:G_PROTEIN_RECEP_F1_2 domain-containing protein n=1 Tax=Enterobius vermicularis TaxID=51028 RepID=A0A0N4VQI6_ENTVE